MNRTMRKVLIPLTMVGVLFLLLTRHAALPSSGEAATDDRVSLLLPDNPMDTQGLQEMLTLSAPSFRAPGGDRFHSYALSNAEQETGLTACFAQYRSVVLPNIPGTHEAGLLFPFHYFW